LGEGGAAPLHTKLGTNFCMVYGRCHVKKPLTFLFGGKTTSGDATFSDVGQLAPLGTKLRGDQAPWHHSLRGDFKS